MSYRIAIAVLLALGAGNASAQQIAAFGSEQQAITYCRGGGVVWWVDGKNKVYVYKGSPHYGKGNDGAYVCETDAVAAGGHPLQSHRTN